MTIGVGRRGWLALLTLAMWLPAVAATVYKHVGPDGKVTYTDTPPAGGGTTVIVATPDEPADTGGASSPFATARHAFATQIVLPSSGAGKAPTPPAGVFRQVRYTSTVGQLGAYLTPDPKDQRRHPAIVWITGGDCNSVDAVWNPGPRSNDQSASAYREAGIVMMFPSLRGGNDNPGHREGFYGEIDDVIAAARYLAKVPYVDPTRIYLGGHSTGGTLALLTAEATTRFRAVFAFGPVAEAASYGSNVFPVDMRGYDAREAALRAPVRWLSSLRSPVFVIEGTGGNIRDLLELRQSGGGPQVKFLAVPGVSHFAVLAPANEIIAQKILKDSGAAAQIALSEEEIAQAARR